MAQIGDIFYRYEDYYETDFVEISEHKYIVSKVTPRGVRLRSEYCDPSPKDHFVLLGDGRRFAYPTRELAQDSYRRRKDWHRRRLDSESARLELIEELLKTDNPFSQHHTQLESDPWLI